LSEFEKHEAGFTKRDARSLTKPFKTLVLGLGNRNHVSRRSALAERMARISPADWRSAFLLI
jgi:hypothetical protein